MATESQVKVPAIGPPPALALFASATLIVEGTLLFGAATGRIEPIAFVAVHALIVCIICYWLASLRRMGSDTSSAVFFLIATAVAGPFGAMGGLLIDWLSQQRREHIDRLQFWYDRIALSTESDAVTQLSDHVAMGRAVDLGAPAPLSFAGLIESGTIAEKQSILGLIARRFHPDYLPTIKSALISPEPVIRVQAAAVAARVRGDLGLLVRRLLAAAEAEPSDLREVQRLIGQIRQCITSGLMEDKDVDRIMRPLQALEAKIHFSKLPSDTQLQSKFGRVDLTEAAEARSLYEDQLLEQGRFAEFRALRRSLTWPRRGTLRYRPMPRLTRVRAGTFETRGLS